MQREIKSYVLRAGRISNRQQQGLDHVSKYELPMCESPWNFAEIFGREADTIVEIGFGMGASLAAMAAAQPEVNFIGIEVHQAGVGSLAADLHEQGISNVRIAALDAVEVFRTYIEDGALAGIQIFFPDPWPKKKHHKRRLVQNEFVRELTRKLRVGGFIHCATDWENYAEHMLTVLSSQPNLCNTQASGEFSPRPQSRPLTKFEKRGQLLGHGVWDLVFKRQ